MTFSDEQRYFISLHGEDPNSLFVEWAALRYEDQHVLYDDDMPDKYSNSLGRRCYHLWWKMTGLEFMERCGIGAQNE